ncbi:recombinase family protein [Peribacillus asahii]|uniref:recombinase family protein n=1 Tax=Peribacillus asahii TaxID=228899 RepID=UPI003816DC8F
MRKTAIYTRVSTDKEEQKLSFDSQAEYYTQYCKEKGYDLYNIYADEGITGTKKNRKQFVSMLIDAGLDVTRNKNNTITGFEKSDREPKFSYILMKDITRFSRNTNVIDTVRALRDKKVYLIFENMNLSTEKDGWELEFNLYLTFSQQDSLDKSKKLRWTYERKKEKGEFHMSNPLFGYEYDSEQDKYVIKEDEALWVRKAFNLYINELKGTKSIAHYLNDNNVLTRRNKQWRADGVKRMLKNEKYMGRVVIGKLKNPEVTSETKTKVKRDQDDWKIIEGGIPAIVSEEIFNRAQEILETRVKNMADGSKVGYKKINSIFHEKIKCSKCESYYTRLSTKKMRRGEEVTEYTYSCINRRMFGISKCDMRGVSHNVLMREIQRMIDTGVIKQLIMKVSDTNSEGLENNEFKKILDEINKQRNESEVKTNEIQAQIDDLSVKIDKLYDVFLSDDTNQMMKKATEKKIGEFTSQQEQLELEKLNYSFAELDKKEREIKQYHASMEQLARKKTFTIEEIINWIDWIEVHQNRALRFFFKFPSMYNLSFENNYNRDEEDFVLTGYDVKY